MQLRDGIQTLPRWLRSPLQQPTKRYEGDHVFRGIGVIQLDGTTCINRFCWGLGDREPVLNMDTTDGDTENLSQCLRAQTGLW